MLLKVQNYTKSCDFRHPVHHFNTLIPHFHAILHIQMCQMYISVALLPIFKESILRLRLRFRTKLSSQQSPQTSLASIPPAYPH